MAYMSWPQMPPERRWMPLSLVAFKVSQAGWASEQPDLAVGVPVHCRGACGVWVGWTRWPLCILPTQMIIWLTVQGTQRDRALTLIHAITWIQHLHYMPEVGSVESLSFPFTFRVVFADWIFHRAGKIFSALLSRAVIEQYSVLWFLIVHGMKRCLCMCWCVVWVCCVYVSNHLFVA